ncbi:MAG: hypothetical protein ABSD90_06450 [Methylocystis sp.]|jgi:hypothetical protein
MTAPVKEYSANDNENNNLYQRFTLRIGKRSHRLGLKRGATGRQAELIELKA